MTAPSEPQGRRPTGLLASLGDLAAMLAATLAILIGMWNWGLPNHGLARAMAWFLSALLGAWGAVSWGMGRLDGPDGRAIRAVLLLLALHTLAGAAFLVPVDPATARGLSPALAEVLDSFAPAGLPAPEGPVALSLAPERTRRHVEASLAIFLFALGIAPLAMRRTGARFLFTTVVAATIIEGALGVMVFVFRGVSRAYGAIYNPNHHAALVLMGIPCAMSLLYLLPHYRRRFRGDVGGGRNPLLPLYAMVLIALTGWIAALSRSSLFLGGALVCVWAFWEHRRIRARRIKEGLVGDDDPARRIQTAIVTGVVALFSALALVVFGSDVVARVSELEEVRSIDRLANARATIEGLRSTAWIGTGPGATEYTINRYVTFSTRSAPVHTHNDYVEVLAEHGLAGGVLLAIGAAYALWAIATHRRALRQRYSANQLMLSRAGLVGVASIALHSATDFPLRIPVILMLALMLLLASIGPGAPRLFGFSGDSK